MTTLHLALVLDVAALTSWLLAAPTLRRRPLAVPVDVGGDRS